MFSTITFSNQNNRSLWGYSQQARSFAARKSEGFFIFSWASITWPEQLLLHKKAKSGGAVSKTSVNKHRRRVFRAILRLHPAPLLDIHSQTSLSTSPRGNPRRHFEVKIFSNVYIRAAQFIVKNQLAILIQTPTRSYSPMTTIQLCLLRLFHIAGVSGAWEARFVAAHVDESEGRPSSRFRCEYCHSLIWAETKHALLKLHWHSRREIGVKDIQICIHAAADPEKATQTVFSSTRNYLCYRHLNNRSTGIKLYSKHLLFTVAIKTKVS